MAYRSPARWLAPAALATVFIITCVILISGGGDGGSRSGATEPATTTATTSPAARRAPARRAPRFYTVKAGDVLSSIAIGNGLSVERLQELNPGVDAQTLRPGQRLKLTR